MSLFVLLLLASCERSGLPAKDEKSTEIVTFSEMSTAAYVAAHIRRNWEQENWQKQILKENPLKQCISLVPKHDKDIMPLECNSQLATISKYVPYDQLQ